MARAPREGTITARRRGYTYVCGHCSTAPRTARPKISHTHCPGDPCACHAQGHRPDENIRKSQALATSLPAEECKRLDPGLSAAEAKDHTSKIAATAAATLKAKEAKTMTTKTTTTKSRKTAATKSDPGGFVQRAGESAVTAELSRAAMREALGKAGLPGAANLRREAAVELMVAFKKSGAKALAGLRVTSSGEVVKADAPAKAPAKKAAATKAPAKATTKAPAKKAPAKGTTTKARGTRKAA